MKGSSRLLVKIYLYGVVTLVAATGTYVAFYTTLKAGRDDRLAQLAEHLVTSLALRRADPVAFRDELARLERPPGIAVSLYDPAGALIASTVTPALPLQPADLEALAGVDHAKVGDAMFAHVVRDKGRVEAIGIVRYRPAAMEQIVMPLGVLVILLLGVAVFLSRHLATPLERIAAAARRFGGGELSARADVNRRDEIGEVGRAFDEMADRVTRLMTAQQELMANVSHELRTPLARMRVAVDLVTDGVADQAKELLPEIAHDLLELERLVEDVMAIARLDLSRGRASDSGPLLRVERVAAHAIVERAANRFRAQHRDRELIVEGETEGQSEGAAMLDADVVLLRRVIENLLDNAQKYSDGGTPIRLALRRAEPRRVVLTVTDQGIGLDESDLKQVFTPFFRSDRSRSRATGGVGLGLVLSKRVVEAHHGTIRIESAAGAGTTVRIELPEAPEPRDAAQSAAPLISAERLP